MEKHPEKGHYRKFTQRQQMLIKMAAASKIKHFRKPEIIKMIGENKCASTIKEYEEILEGLIRT